MKWCRIQLARGPVYAAIDGDEIEVLTAAPFEPYARTGERHRLADAKLLPPVMPPNFYAAGLNFRAHIEWANKHHGMNLKVPEKADIGYRSVNALVGSGAEIVIPRDSRGGDRHSARFAGSDRVRRRTRGRGGEKGKAPD